MTAHFPFGILAVTDASVPEEIPNWTSPDEQVTASGSSIVIRVLHGSEGEVDIEVRYSDEPKWGVLLYSGTITILSGELTVGDALLEQVVRVSLPNGPHPVAIYSNSVVEPSHVAIVIDSHLDA